MNTLETTLALALVSALALTLSACGDDGGNTDPTTTQASVTCGTVTCGAGQTCVDASTGTCMANVTTNPIDPTTNPSAITDAQVCQLFQMCMPDLTQADCDGVVPDLDASCRECLVASSCAEIDAGDCDWQCFGPAEVSDDDVCTKFRMCMPEITFAQCEATIPGFDQTCRTCLMAESCGSIDAGACDPLCLTEGGWINDAEVCTKFKMCMPGLTDADCAPVVPSMNQACRTCVLQQSCDATDDGACDSICGF